MLHHNISSCTDGHRIKNYEVVIAVVVVVTTIAAIAITIRKGRWRKMRFKTATEGEEE